MRKHKVMILALFSAMAQGQSFNDEPPVVLLPNSGQAPTGAQLLNEAQQALTGQTASEIVVKPSPAADPFDNTTPANPAAMPATTATQTITLPQGSISNAPLASNHANLPAWSGYQAAESMAANGNPDLALKQLEARLASAPEDAKAAYLKGLILMQLGRGEDAERWFKMMQSNFPNLPQPYNALAVIYSGRNDWPAAQQVLEALLKIDPKHHNARLNLANVHVKLAKIQYEEALKQKPNDAMLMQKLQQLEGL